MANTTIYEDEAIGLHNRAATKQQLLGILIVQGLVCCIY